MSSATTNLVVVGAGYAGVTAANRFCASLTAEEALGVEVLMINPLPKFVERIRLHELAAGTVSTVSRSLAEMLHPKVRVLVGTVAYIDPDQKAVDVVTPDGLVEISYSTLIYAVGSSTAQNIPGVLEHSYPLGDLEGALRARAAIASSQAGIRVVVVGGGATGVEVASEISEQRTDASVTLLSSGPVLQFMLPKARRDIEKTLRRLKIDVRDDARVEKVTAAGVELADGTTVPSDVTIWAASFRVPELAKVSGLAVDSAGRLRVDEHLQALDYPDIIGGGDAIKTPDTVGAHLRMSCAAAIPLGGQAADTALARLRGTRPTALSVGYLIQCFSLGRKAGYIQFVRADDTPRHMHIAGKLGATIKESICRMVVSGPQKEITKPNSYFTPKGPKRTKQTTVAR
ncbi:hypothetical protein E3T28_16115 [Cryobacterium sinapicolor]|uniref:FAD/NAD(P)-binding domain-containing protein n=1 Tax=Cryobacterium sinapicolor TaxID=1259236 RepID=A0ABY2ISZ2_9MICO|nr:FAD-dependent oxidoreductase [Cryobacterium sinapicolor]TFC93923.1 hypothetical protein E3T28_16115 [Cryobacterium sinapicolor]